MPPDPDLDHKILIQYLIESIRCTECDSPYAEQDVNVVAQDDQAWTLLVICSVCGAESMIMAYLDDEGGSKIPPDDQEVAAWGRFLEHFDGDLRDLLQY
jgi:hypothetical protein